MDIFDVIGNWSLATVAGLIAVVGIAFGFFPASVLGMVTAFLLGLVPVFLWGVNKDAPGGTSGAMGLTLMVVGSLVCFLVPAWITHWLK